MCLYLLNASNVDLALKLRKCIKFNTLKYNIILNDVIFSIKIVHNAINRLYCLNIGRSEINIGKEVYDIVNYVSIIGFELPHVSLNATYSVALLSLKTGNINLHDQPGMAYNK